MTSNEGYTTIAKVKSRMKNFNTDITDTEIDEYINHAEGLIYSITKVQKWNTVPQLIEGLATDIAALYLLANDPSGFTNIVEAAFIADLLWATSRRGIQLISDERVIQDLKSKESS